MDGVRETNPGLPRRRVAPAVQTAVRTIRGAVALQVSIPCSAAASAAPPAWLQVARRQSAGRALGLPPGAGLLVLLTVAMGAGCNKNSAAGTNPTPASSPAASAADTTAPATAMPSTAGGDSRSQVETVYTNVSVGIAKADLDTFLRLVKPAKGVKMTIPTAEQWKQAVPFLKNQYPPLTQTKFIRLEQKNPNEVRYFMQTTLEDTTYTTVTALIFVRATDGQWQLSGGSFSNTFTASSNAPEQSAKIETTIGDLNKKIDTEQK